MGILFLNNKSWSGPFFFVTAVDGTKIEESIDQDEERKKVGLEVLQGPEHGPLDLPVQGRIQVSDGGEEPEILD